MTTKIPESIAAFKKDIGDEAFSVWERVIKRSQANATRNLDAECRLLEAEPVNEGVSIDYADNLLSSLAVKIQQGV